MDTKLMAKQMIDFHKATFDNTFNAMVTLQEQTEKMVNLFIEQATWMPADGKKVMNDWISAYKKGREEYKKTVDENFKKVESFFVNAKSDQK